MYVFLSCLYEALISAAVSFNNSLHCSLLISSDLPCKHLLFFQVIVEKSMGSFSLLSLTDLSITF